MCFILFISIHESIVINMGGITIIRSVFVHKGDWVKLEYVKLNFLNFIGNNLMFDLCS